MYMYMDAVPYLNMYIHMYMYTWISSQCMKLVSDTCMCVCFYNTHTWETLNNYM